MAGTPGAWPDLEKVALIVCDSFGVGEAPDAATLPRISRPMARSKGSITPGGKPFG